MRNWQLVDPDSGLDVARELRSYLIPDFSRWKEPKEFEAAIRKVVSALHNPPSDQSLPPHVQEKVSKLIQGLRESYPGDREKAARALGRLAARRDGSARAPEETERLKWSSSRCGCMGAG